MGLTIHFSLRLPASFTQDAATAAIAKLWQACHRLPFQGQTIMVTLDEARIRAALAGSAALADFRWACIQHERTLRYAHDASGVPYVLGTDAKLSVSIHARIQAKLLVGFSLLPGEGCEPLNLFVGTFPASQMVRCEGHQHGYPSGKRRLMLDAPLRWTGAAFCKSQYASVPEAGGITNFLRCHLLVVAALDAARDLGFTVEVRDEGGYWQKRSVPDLVREIGDWNAYLLAVGAQLKGVFGDQVQAALTPERAAAPVDAGAAAALGDDVLDLIKRTGGTCAATPTAAATAQSL
jgi:hypothetical protein